MSARGALELQSLRNLGRKVKVKAQGYRVPVTHTGMRLRTGVLGAEGQNGLEAAGTQRVLPDL